MSDGTDLHDTIRTVVQRTELLDRLARGPTAKRDLRDHLDVSRSTVYKAVRDLEERNLVEQTGEGVRLTLFGRLLAECYRSFVETATDLHRQQTLLSVLPPDVPVTTDLLSGTDFVLAERHAPSHPLDVVEDVVVAADHVAVVSPVVFRRFVNLFSEQFVAGDLHAEIVFERDAVTHLRNHYDDRFHGALAADCCTVWETAETLPFGLVVAEGDEDEVAVVVYDDEGKPVGTIRNDTPAAIDWGLDVFERYRAEATEVDEC